MRNSLHRKKLLLALRAIERGQPDVAEKMDYHQVLRMKFIFIFQIFQKKNFFFEKLKKLFFKKTKIKIILSFLFLLLLFFFQFKGWLDDVGLPQFRDSFAEARIDGPTLSELTVEDLLTLKITSALHHATISRGIETLRQIGFNLSRLQRKYMPVSIIFNCPRPYLDIC